MLVMAKPKVNAAKPGQRQRFALAIADLEGDIVHKRSQGYELTELGGELPDANAAADPDGRLALAV